MVSLTSNLAALLSAEILTVSGESVTGRDAAAAGAVNGMWRRLERDLAAGLALRHEAEADEDALRNRLRDFRYSRRLISAEDFQGWLDARELDIDDVLDALERTLLRHQLGSPGEASHVDADEMLDALPAEAVCSGALGECAQWLAWRLLVLGLHPGSEVSGQELEAAATAEAQLIAPSALPEALDVQRRRLIWVLNAQAAFDEWAAGVASPDAIAERMHEHRLDWMHFELEGFRGLSEGAAAEVALLLREGSETVDNVARLAGVEPARASLRFEEAFPELGVRLAGASAAEVLDPIQDEFGFEVWRVMNRTPLDPGDERLAARARGEIVEAELEQMGAGRIAWRERI